MDLSLDDIIKKNNGGKKNKRPRSRSRKGNVGGNLNRILPRNGKIKKTPRPPLQNKDKPRSSYQNKKSGGVADARLKIIQSNRQRLIDARDKISQLTRPKQTDARNRIKSRNQKAQYQDRIRERLSRIANKPNRNPSDNLLLQRSIRNNNVSNFRDPSSLIRCTINRTDFQQPYEEDMEIDSPLPIRTHSDLSNFKVVAQNDYMQYRQDYLPTPLEPVYPEYDQPMYSRQLDLQRELMAGRNERRMSQEMRARLDTPAKSPPQYSAPPAPVSPLPSQGHRIVVSNLHSSVTHEDIKELFEDIGPLVTSRLVRPGTAEVIYKLQKDAKKAVEAYHNRQLDGQPMKCLLVVPRVPAGPSGVLRSNIMPMTPKFPVSSKSMVVPDLSAIHKALFTHK